MEQIILKKCTNQALSQSETLKLEMWLKESAENRKIYAQMHLCLLYPDQLKRDQVQKEVWTNVRSKISTQEKPVKNPWYRIAAIFILCSVLALTLYHFNKKNAPGPELKIVERVSLPGQKLTTMLPDGTVVKMNSNSKIQLSEGFQGDIREITLSGEAFFDVEKDVSRPFIIKTKDIQVEVLGTSFNVRSYPDEDRSVVAVASGKVAVSDANNKRENLVTTEKVEYDSRTNTFVKEYYENWESEFGWKEKIILIQNNDFYEITKILQEWYGVEFKVNNSLLTLDKKFSGRYKDPSLSAILEGLSFVYNFEYIIKDKKVIIN